MNGKGKTAKIPPLTSQGIGILAGNSMSSSIGITSQNDQIIGIIMPPEWDDAPITFQWSLDDGYFYDIFDRNGHEQNFVWTPNAFVPVASQYGFYPFPYLQIRSGSRALPVPQSADRWFTIISQ